MDSIKIKVDSIPMTKIKRFTRVDLTSLNSMERKRISKIKEVSETIKEASVAKREDLVATREDLEAIREALINIRSSIKEVSIIKVARISTITKSSKNKINKILLFTF